MVLLTSFTNFCTARMTFLMEVISTRWPPISLISVAKSVQDFPALLATSTLMFG